MSDVKENDNSQPSEDGSFPEISSIPSARELGSRIGPYMLLNILGEGGFGIVYFAEQSEPVKRRVALKVIKPGMDTKQVIARFEAERQALALLEHPNIARVFEAGTTEAGRPYFAMELVKGLPITEHCDYYKLSIEERLELFLQVCDAVQHAHQKGIIHRDLKPSNILVSTRGGKPLPVIIDFGVAKAISQPLTERTLYTEQGQLIGTPEYMSPEQADIGNRDIDTRTDIYSLGVILYTLLSGVLPFDPEMFRDGGVERIRKIICEEEPKTPSMRLSKTCIGESTRSAQCRRTDVRTLQRKLQGDLDWITLKAMEKDRTRRYATVDAMEADIRNHLTHQPVTAAPPGTLYLARKFARRHRQAVAAAGAGIVLLFVLLWAAYVYVQAGRERTYAQALERERIMAEAQLLARLGPQSWEIWLADLDPNVPTVDALGPVQSVEEHCREAIRVCNGVLEVSPNSYDCQWARTAAALWIGDDRASAYMLELERCLGRVDMGAYDCRKQALQILASPVLRERLVPLALVLARRTVAQHNRYAREIALLLDRMGQREQAARLLQMAEAAPLEGSCRYEQKSDTYTVVGGGSDIYGTSDEFHFASKRLNGDGSIAARIESIENVHEWAKAGVMIRESLDPGAAFAGVYATPSMGVHYEARLFTGRGFVSDAFSNNATLEQNALSVPVWLKVERKGDLFGAFYSPDGVTWTPMVFNRHEIPMPDCVYVGLAVTAHDGRKTAEACISHVTVTGNVTSPGPFEESQDIFVRLQLTPNNTDNK